MLALVKIWREGIILVSGGVYNGKQQDQKCNTVKRRCDGVTFICKMTLAWEQKSNTMLN